MEFTPYRTKLKRIATSPLAWIIYMAIAVVCLAIFVFSMIGTKSIPVMGEIKKRGTLIIGVLDNHEPFGYIDSEGNIAGFEVDLARMLCTEILGQGSERLKPVSNKTRGAYLDFNYVDVLVSMVNKNSINQEKYNMTDIYYSDPVVFLSKNKDFQLKNNSENVIGVMLGSSAKSVLIEYLVKHGYDQVQLMDLASFPDALELLESGKISAICYEKSYLKKYANYGLFLIDLRIGGLNYAITVRKNENDLFKHVNEAFKNLKQNGALDALYQKYGLEKP